MITPTHLPPTACVGHPDPAPGTQDSSIGRRALVRPQQLDPVGDSKDRCVKQFRGTDDLYTY